MQWHIKAMDNLGLSKVAAWVPTSTHGAGEGQLRLCQWGRVLECHIRWAPPFEAQGEAMGQGRPWGPRKFLALGREPSSAPLLQTTSLDLIPSAFTELSFGNSLSHCCFPSRWAGAVEFARGRLGHCAVCPSWPERLFSPPKDFG